ncbi:MAG: acyl carrier protein [bacterium]
MADRTQIKARLQNVFRDVFDNEEIELFDEMTAEDVEEWDSLKHVQLVVASEQEFGVTFKTAEIMELKNVGEFISLIHKKLA